MAVTASVRLLKKVLAISIQHHSQKYYVFDNQFNPGFHLFKMILVQPARSFDSFYTLLTMTGLDLGGLLELRFKIRRYFQVLKVCAIHGLSIFSV